MFVPFINYSLLWNLVYQNIFLDLSSAMCTGFNASTGSNVTNASVSVGYSYPYQPSSYSFDYDPPAFANVFENCTAVTESRQLFVGSAQYFVFMSVISFIYGILIVAFYVFFYTKKLDIYKYAAVVVSVCV